jgi:hypothetical protein
MAPKVFRVAAISVILGLSAQSQSLAANPPDPYSRLPQECQKYADGLRSGAIDPQSEIESTPRGSKKVLGTVGMGIGLGSGAFMALSFVLLGPPGGLLATAIVSAIPAGITVGSGYMFYAGMKDATKLNCMQIARGIQINQSIGNNTHPSVYQGRESRRAETQDTGKSDPVRVTGMIAN